MKPCEINEEGKPTCSHIEDLEKILSEMPSKDEIQRNAEYNQITC